MHVNQTPSRPFIGLCHHLLCWGEHSPLHWSWNSGSVSSGQSQRRRPTYLNLLVTPNAAQEAVVPFHRNGALLACPPGLTCFFPWCSYMFHVLFLYAVLVHPCISESGRDQQCTQEAQIHAGTGGTQPCRMYLKISMIGSQKRAGIPNKNASVSYYW